MDPMLSQESYLNRVGFFVKRIYVLWLVCKGIFVLLQAFDNNHSFLSFFSIIIRFFSCRSFLFYHGFFLFSLHRVEPCGRSSVGSGWSAEISEIRNSKQHRHSREVGHSSEAIMQQAC